MRLLEQRCQDVGSAISFLCTSWIERSGFDGRFRGGILPVVKVVDFSMNDHGLDADLTKNFEEMRREGDIDEMEFRNIQSLLEKESKLTS